MKNAPSGPSRMIVLSADGMRPDLYRRPEEFGLKVSNLRQLVEAGASADAVESIYPTTTYPAHATLVTGVPPRGHGIYSHLASLDPTAKARPWHWFARAIRVPALWDVAQAGGRKVAAVGWPVSAGARIDFNIPEIWDAAAPDPHRDFQTAARHSTPGLFEEVLKILRPSLPSASPDELRARAALHIWVRHRPDLLFVHFVHYDQTAHHFGPLSKQALRALEKMDEEIGRLRDQVAEEAPVDWIVLSDHGFLPVEKEVAPLVSLDAEGLFGRNADGSICLKRLGAVHAGGSFALYWLEEPTADGRRSLDRPHARLRDAFAGWTRARRGRRRLQRQSHDTCQRGSLRPDHQQLAAGPLTVESDPDAELMLDAAPGYYFSDRFDGPVIRETVKDRGTHGHLPSRPGLEASFIAVGNGIAPGKKLGRISLTEIAPTLARQLGLSPDALASKAPALDLG